MIQGNFQVTFTLTGASEVAKMIDVFGKAAVRAAGGAMYREVQRIIAAAKDRIPVDLGILRNSGFVNPPEINGDGVTVTGGFGGAASGYAIYVHEGTGPAVGRPAFLPPVNPGTPLGEWARRHGITNPRGLARVVGARGLTPRKFLETAFNEAVDGVDSRLAAEIGAELTRAMYR